MLQPCKDVAVRGLQVRHRLTVSVSDPWRCDAVWCGAVKLSVWTCGHIPNEIHWMNEPVVAREPRPAMCMCMNAAHRPDWARWCEWGPSSSSSSRLSQWRTVLKGQQLWRDWDPVRTSAAAAHWQTVSIHSPDSPPPSPSPPHSRCCDGRHDDDLGFCLQHRPEMLQALEDGPRAGERLAAFTLKHNKDGGFEDSRGCVRWKFGREQLTF